MALVRCGGGGVLWVSQSELSKVLSDGHGIDDGFHARREASSAGQGAGSEPEEWGKQGEGEMI